MSDVDVQESIEDFRARAREWLAANVPERGSEGMRPRGAEGGGRLTGGSRGLQKALYDAGFIGITVSKDFGGQGLTAAHEQAFREESARYGYLPGPNMACAGPMLTHASDDFNRRHMPSILSGEHTVVQFFSEPGAGSDLAGVRTRAERDGERWVLNGAKIWSTGAAHATHGMCLARTDWDVPKHRGLTWFYVPCDARGVTVQPIKEISGGEDFCQEFFDDVELADVDVIGDVNDGWSVTQTMLVYERGAAPGGGAGLAMMMRPTKRKLAPDLVALAEKSGRTEDPQVRQQIACAHINDFARGQLGRRVGQLISKGVANPAGIASYGKLASGTLDPIRARIGLEVGRTSALLWESGDIDAQSASLNYLNGRIMSIAGGTNEIQRNGIGERVLGLPREPSFDSGKPFRQVVADAENWTGEGRVAMGVLDDKDEIRELMRRYNQAIDFPDPHVWVDCFTDDAVVEITGRPRLTGKDELLAYAEQRPGGSLHLATSEIIDVDGDTAHVSSYIAVVSAASGTPAIMIGGKYEDDLRRIDGAWKFSHRNLEMTIRPGG